jgi:chloramphenicol O-acetyltransferase type B
VHFNGMLIMGAGQVTIGDNFHSGAECVIISEIHDYEGDALPYDATRIPRPVHIGDNVWLGYRVMVLGGVTIGEGAIIQAGSVVVRSIPPYAIAGGHPANVFASRDIEHYRRALSEGRFT